MSDFAYLTPTQALENLHAGLSLQQWLGVRESDGFRFIRWLEIDRTSEGWTVYLSDSLDCGDLDHGDMTEFHNDNDPDCPEGIPYSCKAVDEALAICAELGCLPDRYVKFCEIQSIYQKYLRVAGPPKRNPREYFTDWAT